MCGEMIMAGALKCRYCGEVFDEDLRRAGKHRGRPLASRGARLVAALLDGFIMLIVAAPGFFLMIAAANERDRRSIVLAVTILLAGLAVVGVIQWVLLSTRGQTIGKIALGVRIVRYSDGGEVGFVTAVLLRSIVPGLIGAVPYVGGLFGLVDILFIFGEERRCIHDLIAGTMVVEA
jgi:uncharacterized RDD family membrane protein YckC